MEAGPGRVVGVREEAGEGFGEGGVWERGGGGVDLVADDVEGVGEGEGEEEVELLGGEGGAEGVGGVGEEEPFYFEV